MRYVLFDEDATDAGGLAPWPAPCQMPEYGCACGKPELIPLACWFIVRNDGTVRVIEDAKILSKDPWSLN